MSPLEALTLGIVEGLTEFLPISSTGHLILVSRLLGIEQSETHKSFEIVIQLGSILAVVALYFKRLVGDFNLLTKLAVAFLPTGAIGFLFYKQIKALFAAETVAYSLMIGGAILIAVELFYKPKKRLISDSNNIDFKQAFLIGCAQCFSMIPGASRSAATIIGGLLCGLDRSTAALFSFLLAIPTMLIAAGYDLYKNYDSFSADQTINLAIGFVAAFLVALVVIKTFLLFISRFNFAPFGVYRIFAGAIFLWIVG
ncbi:MAG: undecaprenyl-diphosphate phosphatase [Helicobacteraceae bacterium]|jgi:undecaprenyl-diphosphatase|nr:undecaprenyl-diphosphate phosphatase [Helicobacteraceae bacterium]